MAPEREARTREARWIGGDVAEVSRKAAGGRGKPVGRADQQAMRAEGISGSPSIAALSYERRSEKKKAPPEGDA